MDNNSNKQGLCKSGCGFHGNPHFQDMCSKCYNELVKKSNDGNSITNHSNIPLDTSSKLPQIATDNHSIDGINTPQSSSDGYKSHEPDYRPSNGVNHATSTLTDLLQAGTKRSSNGSPRSSPTKAKDQIKSISPDFRNELPVAVSSPESMLYHKFSSSAPDLQKLDAEVQSNQLLSKSESTQGESPKVVRPRCKMCRKKVGLLGYDCRCGGHFCGLHRYSDTHGCDFDYRSQGQQEIRDRNPEIRGAKCRKI